MLFGTFSVKAFNDAKVEVGRSLAAVENPLRLQQLAKIQTEYNKTNDPKARVVQGKLHVITVNNNVEVAVLDLKNRQFEINNQYIQLSKAAVPEEEISKIKQILAKGQVLGVTQIRSRPEDEKMAIAIYNLLLIAITYGT